jgi:paraquat-inducible protein A
MIDSAFADAEIVISYPTRNLHFSSAIALRVELSHTGAPERDSRSNIPMNTIHICCHQCGSQVPMVDLQPGEALHCGLCKSRLMRKRRSESFQPSCAFALAGLLFLTLANVYPIMNFSVAGNTQANEIVTGVRVLVAQGYGLISLLVFFCAMLAPAVYFAGVAYVSLACMRHRGLPMAGKVLAVVRRVQPWSLVPVFAAACMVSAVKLALIGTVDWQPGIRWIALLALCALALGSLFDAAAAERALQGKEGRA